MASQRRRDFAKHGLDVEVIFMRGGALITMGILSGELQLSVVAAKVDDGIHENYRRSVLEETQEIFARLFQKITLSHARIVTHRSASSW